MLLSKVVLFSLFCGVKTERNCALNQIIHRAIEEFQSSTVYFVDFEDTFLSYYFEKPFDIPLIILNTISSNKDLKSVEDNIILVVQVSSSLQVFHHLVNQMKVRKFVIVYGNSLEELQKYFDILWKECFTRIFGIAANITYAFHPFAENPIQEFVLSNETLLPNSLKDLNGFTFRTTVKTDLPRVLWYKDKNGHRQIGGLSGQIFLGFLKQYNATFVETAIEHLDTEPFIAVVNATLSKKIDISMNAYERVDGLEQSYPIKLIKWNILVPFNGLVSSSQYFLKPFQPTVWICLAFMLIYLIVTDMLKDFFGKEPVDLWNSFSRIFLIFLNMPLEKPITKSYWFYFQVMILGFFSVNFYLIFMTSFLTVYIKVKQFDSIQDLIENNVPVMMVKYDFHYYLDRLYHPDGFEKVIVFMDYKSYSKELSSMKNTSFAYADGTDKLEFLLSGQIKPNFHIIKDNLDQYFLGFLLAKHSPFQEILSDFVFQIFTTGLMDKWTRNTYYQAKNEGLINSDLEHVLEEQEAMPLALYHFKFAWICFVVGILFAVGTFAGEVLYFVISRKQLLKKMENYEGNYLF
ncbi:uncharacterized protein LOC129909598 [Episyrphus balteatus]|uniref:uncharacterized protein LOC129909598 n=1 Tax=Episyrphus balteatus TaxID=286459 RepID=UPI0024856045|nr:uncharacterized protein LOC129909598 [Episyrphus balteatus]